MAFKLKNKKLLKIVKELKKASKMHAAQADKVEEFAKGPCGKSMDQCDCESKTLPGISPLAKKDKCYHKAKAKYDVFPSAYASGYIAKCRKRGGKIG